MRSDFSRRRRCRVSGSVGRITARLLCAWAALVFAPQGLADSIPIQVEILMAHAGQSGIPTRPDGRGFRVLDPGSRLSFSSSSVDRWLKIRPAQGQWPDEALVLAVRRAPGASVEVLTDSPFDQGKASQPVQAARPLSGYAMPVFELPSSLAADATLVLHLPASPSAHTARSVIRLDVMPLHDYMRRDASWWALHTVSLGIIGLIALGSLLVAAVFHDRAALLMTLHLGTLAVFLAIASGLADSLQAFAAVSPPFIAGIGRVAALLSMGCAALFVSEFTGLRKRAPHLANGIAVYSLALILVPAVAVIPVDGTLGLAHRLVAPLLGLGLLLVPLSAVVAWRRGCRFGAYVLFGGLPIIGLSLAYLRQVGGGLFLTQSVNEILVMSAAFAAIVLAVGLADRVLVRHGESRLLRRHQKVDPSTGLLSRAGWELKFPGFASRVQAQGSRLFIMSIDLDRQRPAREQSEPCADEATLLTLAGAMRQHFSGESLLCRFDREAFVVALRADDARHAGRMAESLRADIAARGLRCQKSGRPLMMSIGVARHRSGASAMETIQRADAAMNVAKARNPERGLKHAEAV